MNREIKFRAWDKDRNKMLDVQYLYFYKDKIIASMPIKVKGFENLCIEKTNVELMQYTGVHDDSENENEIFQGDVIKFAYEDEEIIGKVEYEAGSYIIVSNELSSGYIPFLKLVDIDRDYWWIPMSKVIGNIYENPELLEVKK